MIRAKRATEIIEQLRSELASAKAKHIQIRHNIDQRNGRSILVFGCIDSPKYEKVMDDIEKRYCETLELKASTKTVRYYYI